MPFQTLGNSFSDVIDAAKIKAQFPVSHLDAFTLATAMRMDAVILTGDPKFRRVEHLVAVNWL